MKSYECSICYAVNHASRIHCQYCGTVPAQYSILAVPTNYERLCEVKAAINCARIVPAHVKHYNSRVYIQSVGFDYYAESSEA